MTFDVVELFGCVGIGGVPGVAVTGGGSSPVQPTQIARIFSLVSILIVAEPSAPTVTLVSQLSIMLQYSPAGIVVETVLENPADLDIAKNPLPDLAIPTASPVDQNSAAGAPAQAVLKAAIL